MESFIRRKVSKQLQKYFKNFDPKSFKLGLLNGQSALENLELNEDIVSELLGLRHVIVESCTISALRIQLSLTALTSEPIQITIEKLHIKIREKSPAEWLQHPHKFPLAFQKVQKANKRKEKTGSSEEMIPVPATAQSPGPTPLNAPPSSSGSPVDPSAPKPPDGELPPEMVVDLKFKDKVIDGLHIRIEEFRLESQNLPINGVMPPKFVLELQGLNLYTTNAEWQVVELRNARSFNKGRSARFVFKVLFVRSFSIALLPASQPGSTIYLLPKDTALNARLIIRKNLENKLTGLQIDLHISSWNHSFSFDLLVQTMLWVKSFVNCLKRKDQKDVVARTKPKVPKTKPKGPKPQILINFLINEINATLPKTLSDADLASVANLDIESFGSQRHSAPALSPGNVRQPGSPLSPTASENEEPLCLHIDDFQLRILLVAQMPANDKIIELILTSLRLEDRNSSTSKVLERIRNSDEYGERQRARRQRFQQRKRRFDLKPGVFTPWLIAPDINIQATGTKADQVMNITGRTNPSGSSNSASGNVKLGTEDAISRSHAIRKEGWLNPEELFELKHPRTFHPLMDATSRRLPLLHLMLNLAKYPTGEEQEQEASFNPDAPHFSKRINLLINPLRLSLTPPSIRYLMRFFESYQYSVKLEAYLQCVLQAIPMPADSADARSSPSTSRGIKTTSSEPALGSVLQTKKKTGAAFQRQLTQIRVVAPSISFSLWSVTDSPTIVALKLSDLSLHIRPLFGKLSLTPATVAIPKCNFFQTSAVAQLATPNFAGIMQQLTLNVCVSVDILHSSPGQQLMHDHCFHIPSIGVEMITSQPDQRALSPAVYKLINVKIPSISIWIEDHQYFALMGILQELKSVFTKSASGSASSSSSSSPAPTRAITASGDPRSTRKLERDLKKQDSKLKKNAKKSAKALKKEARNSKRDAQSAAKNKPPKGPQHMILLLGLNKLVVGIVGYSAVISAEGSVEVYEGNALPISLAEFELNNLELSFETHQVPFVNPNSSPGKVVAPSFQKSLGAQVYIRSIEFSAPTIHGRDAIISTSTAEGTQFLCLDFASTDLKKHVSAALDGLQVTFHLESLAQIILFFFEPLQANPKRAAETMPSPRDSKSAASSRMSQSSPILPDSNSQSPSSSQAAVVPTAAKPALQFEISLRDWKFVLFPVSQSANKGGDVKEFLLHSDQSTSLVCSIGFANFLRSTQTRNRNEMVILLSLGGLSTSLIVKGMNPVPICHPVDLKTNFTIFPPDLLIGKPKSWQLKFQMEQLTVGLDTAQMNMLKDLVGQLLKMKKILRQLFKPKKPSWLGLPDSEAPAAQSLIDIDASVVSGLKYVTTASDLKHLSTKVRLEMQQRFRQLDHIRQPEQRGYLYLKKDAHMTEWNQVWTVLRESKVQWYAKEGDNRTLGSVSLESNALVDPIHDDITSRSNCFAITSSNDQRYFFSAATEDEMTQWIVAILKVQTMVVEIQTIEEENNTSDIKIFEEFEATFARIEQCFKTISECNSTLHHKLEHYEVSNRQLRSNISELRNEFLRDVQERTKLHQQIASLKTELKQEQESLRKLRDEQNQAAVPSSPVSKRHSAIGGAISSAFAPLTNIAGYIPIPGQSSESSSPPIPTQSDSSTQKNLQALGSSKSSAVLSAESFGSEDRNRSSKSRKKLKEAKKEKKEKKHRRRDSVSKAIDSAVSEWQRG